MTALSLSLSLGLWLWLSLHLLTFVIDCSERVQIVPSSPLSPLPSPLSPLSSPRGRHSHMGLRTNTHSLPRGEPSSPSQKASSGSFAMRAGQVHARRHGALRAVAAVKQVASGQGGGEGKEEQNALCSFVSSLFCQSEINVSSLHKSDYHRRYELRPTHSCT